MPFLPRSTHGVGQIEKTIILKKINKIDFVCIYSGGGYIRMGHNVF